MSGCAGWAGKARSEGGPAYSKLAQKEEIEKYTKDEVIQYAREEDVKFIRLAFCDVFGKQKNISIMPDELPRAFEYGIAFDGRLRRQSVLFQPFRSF